MNGVARKDQKINGHAPTDHVRYTGHEMANAGKEPAFFALIQIERLAVLPEFQGPE
jgi:hypothetical protein